ncbi:MFS transporter [Halobacteriales archaeon SW_8_68_21]|nr:MAG: MFS transporter [Halobacteriales archaeon SW_8_68_21]
MDDSDRSRDDDSAADGSTDGSDPNGAVDEGSETGASDERPDETPDPNVGGDESDETAESDADADEPLEAGDVVAAEDAARAEAVDDDSDWDADVGAPDDSDGDEDTDEGDADADEGDEDADEDDEDTDEGDADADEAADSHDADGNEDAESLGDGGTPATPANAAAATDGEDETFGGIEGPETDEEMPLAAHIEEMMRRLAVVFLVGGLATLVVVTESAELINYFWSYHIPAPLENRPRLYGPLELPLTRLKVAGLAGVVVGLPAFVYETYRFMRPGLYQQERRYYLAAVPTSLILGGIGIAFAHFLVLPTMFSYFTTYTSDAATIAFGLAETFNLIVVMLALMAFVFQIPLFIMLAIMMNLVTREWLEAKRLIFWGSFLGIAFLFNPDLTGMAPIIVTLTMIALFEGTLAILRWTGN